LHGERGNAARHRHAELAQDLFTLVFVDLHGGLAAVGVVAPTGVNVRR